MSVTITQIANDYAATKELAVTDMAEVEKLGFRSIINLCPDSKETEQSANTAIQKAAQAAGLGYAHIPVNISGFKEDSVKQMRKALQDLPKPILASCHSKDQATKLHEAATDAQVCALKRIISPNVGSLDRPLRVVVGTGLILGAVFGVIGSWGWIGVLPLATGIFRFCPAYLPFGFSTCRIRK